jgi:anti-sigma factor RsiW
MTCEEVLAELSNYMDDDLPADLRQSLESHVKACHTCEVLLDSLRKTVRIVTNSGTFDLPPAAAERLVDRIMTRVRDGEGG